MNNIAWAKQEKRTFLAPTEMHRFESCAHRVIRNLAKAKVGTSSLYPDEEPTSSQAALTSSAVIHLIYCLSVF